MDCDEWQRVIDPEVMLWFASPSDNAIGSWYVDIQFSDCVQTQPE